MIPVPKTTPPPKIERLSLKDWLKGTVTAFDDGRTPTDGLRASGNVMLDQDGTLRPRPSLVRYGIQPTGTVLGEIFEFVRVESNVPVTYLLIMQNIAGTTKPAYSKDGGAWTTINGKTYDNTAKAHFAQIDDKVLVMNGTDNLSYVDIPTLAVIPYTALSTPGAPTATRNASGAAPWTTNTFTYYYRITANSTVGETAASTAGSVQVGVIRDSWTSASNFDVTVTWSAVVGATSYNVYLGDVAGQETLLVSGINALSYKDDGSAIKDITRLAPVGDSTAGPKVTRATVINGQIFFTGDKDFPRYVRYGGTGSSVLDLSPFNGGGYSEIGKGTKEFPVRVMSFRDGRGNAAITILCRGTNGSGKRYIMTPDSLTVADTIISFFSITEDNGQDGTDSPDGVILYKDSLWYPSRDGFKTTGTKPQLQNILSTSTVSETIINDIRNLSSAYMDKCVGLAKSGRLYWLLPVGSSSNNEMWVLDLDRKGAWMKPWNISGDWQSLYNDNGGTTHHLILKNGIIYELTTAQATNDDGTAFSTNATSGFLKFSDDGLDWAKVIDVTFNLLRPQGSISFIVSGKTEDASLATVGSSSFISNSTVAGWGEAGWGGSPDLAKPRIFGWSNFQTVPLLYGDAQKYITLDVDEELQWLGWEMDSSGTGVEYQLADVIVRYVKIGVKDLT